MSGIASLFGGNSAKTDRKNELQGIGNLNNVFNFGMKGATGEMGAGSALQGQAGDYYSKLLSGNRTANLQAVAPTANAATAQADAAKRNMVASGGARGGGTNAASQQIGTQTQATVDNALNQAKAGAAGGAAALGSTQVNQASQLLGIGSNAAANQAGISSDSRRTSQAIHQQAFSAIDNVLDAIFKLPIGGSSSGGGGSSSGGGGSDPGFGGW